MHAAFDLSDDERATLMRVIQQSLGVTHHVDVLLWLHGDFQQFIPHDILIAAWGDFAAGPLNFDVVSSLPGMRTHQLGGEALTAFMRKLFEGWVQYHRRPYLVDTSGGFSIRGSDFQCATSESLRHMTSAVVHGIKDERGKNDCLYVAFGLHRFANPAGVRRMTEILLPYVDTLMRRAYDPGTPARPTSHHAPEVAEIVEDSKLSMRELEIMEWVREGKTNHEIGVILNISVFTVKNHLQRIFKKLDVLNRAQAVARMSPPMRRSRV